MAKQSLYTRRMQALMEDQPIPMTIAEARRFRKMVCGFIHTDIGNARIQAAADRCNDFIFSKLDRIEAHAFAAVMQSYRGERA